MLLQARPACQARPCQRPSPLVPLCNYVHTSRLYASDRSILSLWSPTCGARSSDLAATSDKVSEANGVTATAASEFEQQLSVSDIKARLRVELEGINRGIFGVTTAKKSLLHGLIAQLEAQTPQPAPTQHLHLVAGDWRLLYSTITITGVKRTKLGLREFISLGEFIQSIDVENNLAVNTVSFAVSALTSLKGALTIKASYTVESDQRVAIKYLESSLTPPQLMTIFQQNLDLLLSIFNPEGHLDITYLDDDVRVGRDDKGNIFLVERCR